MTVADDTEASNMREPFGSPDGASTDPGTFVEFDSVMQWQDLALPAKDKTVRILVGRRGSGKSRYLRRIELEAQSENIVFAQPAELINLNHLKSIGIQFPEKELRLEVWERIWNAAIYSSLCTFLLYHNKIPSGKNLNVSIETKNFLHEKKDKFFKSNNRPRSVVQSLNEILRKKSTQNTLLEFINDPDWSEIEQFVIETISQSSPVFIFIDVLDDNFASAPKESIDCQLGLINWIMKRISDPRISHRLHLVISVRDTVYASLLDSPNGARYNQRNFIRCLDWNHASAAYFLEKKISTLPMDFMAQHVRGKTPIQNWLGIENVVNEHRNNIEEDITDYLLRHTRCLPREIVEIGNALATTIGRNNVIGKKLDSKEIRSLIGSKARTLAVKGLEEVAHHLMALEGVRQETFGTFELYKVWMTDILTGTFLSEIKSEQFDFNQLNSAEKEFHKKVTWWNSDSGAKLNVYDIFWQHGFIGVQRNGDPEEIVRFFHSYSHSQGEPTSKLPVGRLVNFYFLHSSLVDGISVPATNIAPRFMLE